MHIQVTARRTSPVVRTLLAGGVAIAPLFYAVSIIQALTRTGFNLKYHAISNLTLGELGWMQSAAFVLAGLLALLMAIGIRGLLRGGKGGTWGAVLIGIYGVGMIMAGLFKPDPGFGFPPGAPDGMPAAMSNEAAVHMMAFFIAFICLIAASFVHARRFAAIGERRWSVCSMASGIIAIALIVWGMSASSWIGAIMGSAGIAAFGWLSALAVRLRAEAAAR
ncbi:DUF998 domain-containing protein [Paenibacillus sp. J5C_2022]|uniref:DUF998 domain-containing protein n=1 Tax=Paenibacillus sp. J5C2022 TaxID=2977129 RepID=UPI0021D125F9|nr:DUF998 domain-containing protein [Paenibacillus sp. J5C2022]MCU6709097.1 DUF998 domain-containing protein [Paenibacillus sp. J5C2022]